MIENIKKTTTPRTTPKEKPAKKIVEKTKPLIKRSKETVAAEVKPPKLVKVDTEKKVLKNSENTSKTEKANPKTKLQRKSMNLVVRPVPAQPKNTKKIKKAAIKDNNSDAAVKADTATTAKRKKK